MSILKNPETTETQNKPLRKVVYSGNFGTLDGNAQNKQSIPLRKVVHSGNFGIGNPITGGKVRLVSIADT